MSDADGAGGNGIEARGLARCFGPVVAVAGVDLDARPGEITGLLGPNGSGKSTLLRMLVGIVRPDSGEARVGGAALTGDGLAVRRRATYAPGEIALYGEMRAQEHLDWLLRGREPESRARAREIARALELPLAARVRTYSHGMKRQLSFAAALAPRVPVRILDEASEGLDPTKRSALLELLAADARAGTAILLSSHHLGEVDRACARLVFLSRGKVVCADTAERVRERSQRIVRLRFAGGALPHATIARLQALGARSARAIDGGAVVELDAADPRPFLARLAEARDLPAPQSLSWGELSLQDLYRDLYGVEAV